MYLNTLEGDALDKALKAFEEDERTGVKKLCITHRKRYDKQQELIKAWHLRQSFDAYFHEDKKILVGIDEVGRGPLAGPVVAAAVILPDTCHLVGVRDSKKLSEEKREALYELIMAQALGVGIGRVEAQEIDEINILQATFLAMKKALENLQKDYDLILVDGDKIIPSISKEQHAIIKGDDKSAAIAAASIVAKVTRDRLMQAYHNTYPGYDWASNKGYGSQKHYEGIRAYGLTPLHRKSFLKNEG